MDSQTKLGEKLSTWLQGELTPRQLQNLRKKYLYQTDPTIFAQEVLQVKWWDRQKEVALSVAKNQRTLVMAGHGVGKTFMAAGLVLWFYETFVPSIGLTTAPTWAQVRDLLWAEVAQQRRGAHLERSGVGGRFTSYDEGIPLTLRNSEFHYAKGHNARQGEGFQGRHGEHLFAVLDEGPGVPDFIWKATDSMLQSPECRVLAIGNPTTTSGPFYDASHSAQWNVIRMSCLDHPNIPAELLGLAPPLPQAVRLHWVEGMLEKHTLKIPENEADASCFQWPPLSVADKLGVEPQWYQPNDEFRIRVMGLGPLRASSAVWAEEWIELARNRHLEVPSYEPKLQIGVDVARYGNDRTVIMTRAHETLLQIQSFLGNATTETVGWVIETARKLSKTYERSEKSIPIAVDDDGVGGGVTDMLRGEDYNVLGVSAATKAARELKYPNKRSELWFIGADLGRKSQIDLSLLPEEDYLMLRSDLLAPTFILDKKGRRVVERKEQMRKRLGRSPDYADAFNLAFCDVYTSDFVGMFKGDDIEEDNDYGF